MQLNLVYGSIANAIDMKTPKSKTNHEQHLRHGNMNSLLLNLETRRSRKNYTQDTVWQTSTL